MSFIVKESNYDEFIRYNGERMISTPYASDIKDGKAKYCIITENNKFFTDFSIFEEDENEINFNIVIRGNEVIDSIVEYCKKHYDVIKLRTIADYDFDIEKRYNVIEKKVISDTLSLIDYYIKLD